MLYSKHEIAIPPGETIKELLNDRNISVASFAYSMGFAEEADATRLIKGETEIDDVLAHRLQMIFGVGYGFWVNLERNYRQTVKRIKAEKKGVQVNRKREHDGSCADIIAVVKLGCPANNPKCLSNISGHCNNPAPDLSYYKGKLTCSSYRG